MKCKICVVNLQMLSEDSLINTSFAAFPQLFMSLQCILIINNIQTHEAT
jgi:hypothetical protein